jgi:hypothetical protein
VLTVGSIAEIIPPKLSTTLYNLPHDEIFRESIARGDPEEPLPLIPKEVLTDDIPPATFHSEQEHSEL